MQSNYKHIFFDLDHTLWDFEKNSLETLEHLYHSYNLKGFGVPHPDVFIDTYRRINNDMWVQYEKGLIDKQYLREERFNQSFIELGVAPADVPRGIWQQYLDICPTKTNLFPHALEVLEYLHGKYTISIITNGFEETQHRKISNSGMAPFITHLVTSEKAGFAKPNPAIFRYVLQLNNSASHEAVMIGDNVETDIGGAIAAGIYPVFFNPLSWEHGHKDLNEIHSLHQLKDML